MGFAVASGEDVIDSETGASAPGAAELSVGEIEGGMLPEGGGGGDAGVGTATGAGGGGAGATGGLGGADGGSAGAAGAGFVGIGTNSPGRHVCGIRRTDGSFRNRSA